MLDYYNANYCNASYGQCVSWAGCENVTAVCKYPNDYHRWATNPTPCP